MNLLVCQLSLSFNHLFSLAFTFICDMYDILPVFYYASLNKTSFPIFSYVSDQLINSTKLLLIFYFYIFLPFSVPCQVVRISFVGKSVAGLFSVVHGTV